LLPAREPRAERSLSCSCLDPALGGEPPPSAVPSVQAPEHVGYYCRIEPGFGAPKHWISGKQIRVVVVDDHELFRGGLVSLLKERGIDVVGEAGLGAAAVGMAEELTPDVVLMDLNMPGMSGIEATQRIASAAPLTHVVVLTVLSDEADVIDALLAGACGYLLKDSPIDRILEGVQAAARGESLISTRVAGQLVRRVREPGASDPPLSGADLTPRELEVLELLARGLDNPRIAKTLFISHHTVTHHVSSILLKLQVENRIQAAVRAVRTGLV
jgi:DNA-binding NarL/FixJ family response regulator